METASKNNIKVLVVIFAALLIMTNAANYFLVSSGTLGAFGGSETEAEEPTRVIRYDPDRYVYDAETALIWETIDVLTKKHYSPVDLPVLVEGAVRGMLQSVGDPYAQFYSPEDLEEFILDTRGTYGGIGVRIIEVEPYVVVFETMPGTPAERSNLNPGDRIIAADGHDLIGEGVTRAVEILRGPENTSVEVEIVRPGSDEPIKVMVDREEIVVPTVASEMLSDGLGYISLNGFDSNTAAEFGRRLSSLEQQGLEKGLILDLRNNHGGLVDQAIEVAEHLVPEGEIASVIGGEGEVLRTYYSRAVGKTYPIVVLINEESASASELLAGALQDSGAALLVGKTTFGKASVQNLEYLPGNYGLLITVARYFTPSGHDIHEHGISPDFEVEMSEALRYYRYFFPGRLERGSYGPEVEMLQVMLNQIGYEVEDSGYFDQLTADALAEFQEANDLRATGEFDDRTWLVLRVALDEALWCDDEQLNYAIELIGKPGLFTITGGNNQ